MTISRMFNITPTAFFRATALCAPFALLRKISNRPRFLRAPALGEGRVLSAHLGRYLAQVAARPAGFEIPVSSLSFADCVLSKSNSHWPDSPSQGGKD